MARILIVYGSRYGCTQRIAERIAGELRDDGHEARAVDAAAQPDLAGYDALILASSINYGRHQKVLTAFVRSHLPELRAVPTAFLSVSGMAASQDGRSQQEARKCIDRFVEETDWKPSMSTPVGGDLAYTKYPWLLRLMLKAIVKRTGGDHSGDIDTKRDYHYTDWAELTAFIGRFMESVSARKGLVPI